jgi:hypothetical protein
MKIFNVFYFILISFSIFSQKYPVQTTIKGEDVVILTLDQYEGIELILNNQKARNNYYKEDIIKKNKFIDSISLLINDKMCIIDSLDYQIRKKLSDYDSLNSKILYYESWLYERSVSNSYMYYSYSESTIKFIDLSSYIIIGNRRSGNFSLARRGPTSEDEEWKKYNKIVKEEPIYNWENNYKEMWRPRVITFPYKIKSVN